MILYHKHCNWNSLYFSSYFIVVVVIATLMMLRHSSGLRQQFSSCTTLRQATTTTTPSSLQLNRYHHRTTAYFRHQGGSWAKRFSTTAVPVTSTTITMNDGRSSVIELMRDEVSLALSKALGIEPGTRDPMVLPSKPGHHADYQSNIAMTLAKSLKMSPKDVAQKIVDNLVSSSSTPTTTASRVISHADVSGPGFINLHLSDTFVKERIFMKTNDKTGRLGIPKVLSPQKVIVDFSSPNIAKEMHVGHLRSTIIGDSICRVLEFQGHQVLRINHVGDWGTQFGMLIHYLRTHHASLLSRPPQQQGSNHQQEQVLDIDIGDLSTFYKKAKQEFDESESFRNASRQEVVNLQQSTATVTATVTATTTGSMSSTPSTIDPSSSYSLWQIICSKSRTKFQEIYDLLDISLQERGESFYNPLLAPLLERCKQQGILQESQGALVIFPPGFVNEESKPLPLILQKSDGGYLYATTDLAALAYRIEQEKANRLIYVTDAGQSQHFQMVFSAAKLVGILPNDQEKKSPPSLSSSSSSSTTTATTASTTKVNHVTFGLVLGQDGKKIKSRSGETIRLQDLLNEAIDKAKEGFVNRLKESTNSEQQRQQQLEEEINAKAKAMGIAAVKYADLSMNRESSYKFSFEKMLSLTGNTAPYMLYAYVRIEGIKRKALASLASSSSTGSSSSSSSSLISPNVAEGDKDILQKLLQNIDATMLEFSRPEEIVLAKHLLRSDEILKDVEETLYPNKICDYIFELSQKFNAFYEKCPVLQAENERVQLSRLALCSLTSDTLKTFLAILGIKPLSSI